MPTDTLQISVQPLLTLVVVGVLAVGMRWLHGRDRSRFGVPLAVGCEDDDYGLLCVATVAEDLATAQHARRLLAEAGIRATVATGADTRTRVLVFPDELPRARKLVDPAGPAPHG